MLLGEAIARGKVWRECLMEGKPIQTLTNESFRQFLDVAINAMETTRDM